MIHTELWYKEAVRPIRIDPVEVDRVTNQIFEELKDALETYFPGKKVIPVGKYLWTPLWGPRIKVENVVGKTVTIPITVRPTVAGTANLGGALTLQNPKVLVLELPIGNAHADNVKKFLAENRGAVKKSVRGIILHELTHAKDNLKEITYDSAEVRQNPFQYYNDPAEVRAYMQQVAEETYQNLPPMEDGLELREALWVGLDQSPVWAQINPYLEPENRKKVLQGVYNYVQDRWPEDAH